MFGIHITHFHLKQKYYQLFLQIKLQCVFLPGNLSRENPFIFLSIRCLLSLSFVFPFPVSFSLNLRVQKVPFTYSEARCRGGSRGRCPWPPRRRRNGCSSWPSSFRRWCRSPFRGSRAPWGTSRGTSCR